MYSLNFYYPFFCFLFSLFLLKICICVERILSSLHKIDRHPLFLLSLLSRSRLNLSYSPSFFFAEKRISLFLSVSLSLLCPSLSSSSSFPFSFKCFPSPSFFLFPFSVQPRVYERCQPLCLSCSLLSPPYTLSLLSSTSPSSSLFSQQSASSTGKYK